MSDGLQWPGVLAGSRMEDWDFIKWGRHHVRTLYNGPLIIGKSLSLFSVGFLDGV